MDLSGEDLGDVRLYQANLTGADLSGADLTDAYLDSADLSGANLSGADLTDVRGCPLNIPSGYEDRFDDCG